VCELGYWLPFAPGRQAAGVILLGDPERGAAEERAQRGRVGVD
jgi:hypothetical protein